ncbi:MAG TPA: histidine kinase [Pseudonocardiaceae bacterium]|jgi:signal transduction histidine kinase|nr:histidine kinase [Pseudonocardiaceae bacterium]
MVGRVRTHLAALWSGVQQCGFAVVMLVPFVLTVIALAGLAVALFPLFSAVVLSSRQLTNSYRGFLRDRLGPPIPAPYAASPAQADAGAVQPWSAEGLQQVRWLLEDPATWQDLIWMLVNPLIGVTNALFPALLAVYGPVVVGFSWLVHPRIGPVFGSWRLLDPTAFLGGYAWLGLPIGLAVAAVVLALAPWNLRCQLMFSQALLSPTANARLAERVEELTESRANASSAQEAELRRIERDLHDGAQARMVAVGMTLRTVERLLRTDPSAVAELVAEARETSAAALRDLRDLVRGIHPPVLAERGLPDAIRAIALQSPLAVAVDIDLAQPLEPPVEAAVYFAVSELLTNAAKHAEAEHATVTLRPNANRIMVTVGDDGRGGADAERGSGLRGIRRRLATFDATMAISSPAGGPTTVILEIPCASSSPRTSTS